jgi:sugar lactone lactonase YvrE
VDAQGNVYIADSGNDQIVVVPADITPTNRQYAIGGTALKSPFGVAVDAAGDLFVSDYGNNRVVELPAYGQPQTTIAAGLSVPSGLAVDDKGNILTARRRLWSRTSAISPWVSLT